MSKNNPEHWKARMVTDARHAARVLWPHDKKQVDERGLAVFCSQCDRNAVWYGQGGTAYCDACWPGDRHEIPLID